jgi:Secretion system C-terminal sorting domain
MKKSYFQGLITLCFLISFTKAYGQHVNYVRNPSFEDYTICPDQYDEIRRATPWNCIDTTEDQPMGMPEYYNICAGSNMSTGVPRSGLNYQYPRSGGGMAGIQVYNDGRDGPFGYQRDYLQGRLHKTLTVDKEYCVTFYVALLEQSGYAINHVGVYLDDGSVDIGKDSLGSTLPLTMVPPQAFSTIVIFDTLHWTKIQGSFISNGTESFITIGNFSDKAGTVAYLLPHSGSIGAWYFIDDVSVIESGAKADAGADVWVSRGDSVYIGTFEEGMPCTWYELDSTNPIGYSGGLWIKPDSTTSYVVEMDLCGLVTRDTVKVFVAPTGIRSYVEPAEVTIFPNPTSDIVQVASPLVIERITIYDFSGKNVFDQQESGKKCLVSIEQLASGFYYVQIRLTEGQIVWKKIVKQ